LNFLLGGKSKVKRAENRALLRDKIQLVYFIFKLYKTKIDIALFLRVLKHD